MTKTMCPETEIALFSEDGQHWFDADTPDSKRPINWEANEQVTKIVIGTLEKGDEKPKLNSAELPDDLASLYPNLSHLYLWQIKSLTHLPKLPPKLACLDVRGCGGLKSIDELPEVLETLDIGDCVNIADLPSATGQLRYVYINGCSSIADDVMASFLLSLGRSATRLLEFDASACAGIASIKRLPRSLVRLVLRGCENLRDLDALEQFSELKHLDLSGCQSLETLVGIPDKLQYVRLQECQNLVRFMDQDIGPYERGTDERQNVAQTLYSRKKFGDELHASAHAKLLLLGDGRVGKTTLAKRLQWDTLTGKQQLEPAYQLLKPSATELFTHKVRFGRWETKFQLTESVAEELNHRASHLKLPPPCDSRHQIDGAARIWDFGGQEVYHQTHRIFASAGSVFLIVWNDKPFDEQRIRAQKPATLAISDEEWVEWNRRRSLEYWMDYVRSMRPNAEVALVCTYVPKGKPQPAWRDKIRKNRSEQIDRMVEQLDCFYIDSLDPNCFENPEYQRLLAFVREKCGNEAQRIGIWQPRYYSEVSELVDQMLQENDTARQEHEAPRHLLLSNEQWTDAVIYQHQTGGRSQHHLDSKDVETITGYLHDAGQIFRLSAGSTTGIVIDQEWASDLIYRLLRPGHLEPTCLFNLVRKKGGYFTRETLELDDVWKSLPSDNERNQILGLMEQCGIIARVSAEESEFHKDIEFLATEKWFLPTYSDVERICEATFKKVATHGAVIEEFSFEKQEISQLDFRNLMVHLGGILGTRALWFRDGLQASDSTINPNWCFQVRWTPTDEIGFFGTLDARLTAAKTEIAELARQVEECFAMDTSPLAKRAPSLRRAEIEIDDLSHCYFRDTRNEDYDIAISSSGKDKAIVSQIELALKQAGLRTLWYKLPECRLGENIEVMTFMRQLRKPKLLLLFLSDTFLKNDAETNWYCLWEFADAILRVKNGHRTIGQTLVSYAAGGTLTSNNLNDIAVPVLRDMSAFFEERFYRLPQADKDTFRYYRDWSDHFREAVASDAMGAFFQRRGTVGAYSTYSVDASGNYDFSKIVMDAKNALKESK